MVGWLVGLWFLTPISTICQLYPGGQFYWWRKPQNQEKTTDLPQVANKLLSHNVVSSTPRRERALQTHNFSGERHGLYR